MSAIITKGTPIVEKINLGQPIDPEGASNLLIEAMSAADLSIVERIICVHLARALPYAKMELAVRVLSKLWPLMRSSEDESATLTLLVYRLAKCGDDRVLKIALALLRDERNTVRSQAEGMFGKYFADFRSQNERE